MNPPAQRVLEAAGYSADGFIARSLTPQVVAAADLVLTATRRHRGMVAQLHPAHWATPSPCSTSPTCWATSP